MNRIQSKSYRMQTYKINKSLLSYVGDKIYIQNNGCDRLLLIIIVNYNKKHQFK